jgi:site-specific DNA recombinase
MVAIYARTSSDNERKMSIEDQVQRGIKYAEGLEGHPPFKVFIDRGITGKSVHRPEFNRMMTMTKSDDIKYLWFLDQTRAWRNKKEAILLWYDCEGRNIGIVLDDHLLDFDSDTEFLRFVMTSIEGENYIKQTSKKAKISIQNRFPRGGVIGKSPFGFKTNADKKYSINEGEAILVRLIFKLKIEGLSMRKIADHLNDRNLTPEKKWNYSAVDNVLRNVKHYGRFIINEGTKEEIDFTNDELAIISKQTFLKAKEALKQGRTYSGNKSHHADALLKGVLKCGICGSYHTRHKRFSPKGDDWSYYNCGRKNNDGKCEDAKNIREDFIDSFVWRLFERDNVVKRVVLDASQDKAIRSEIKKAQDEIALFQWNIEKIDKQVFKLESAWFGDEGIKKSHYDKLRSEYRQHIERYEKLIEEQERIIENRTSLINNSKDIEKDINSIMANAPLEMKKEYIKRYIKEIFVGYNKEAKCFLLDMSFTHSNEIYAVKFNYNYTDIVELFPNEIKTDLISPKMKHLLSLNKSIIIKDDGKTTMTINKIEEI